MDNDYFLDAGIGIPLLYQFPSTDGLLDSALSSIVSSPGSASNSNEGFAIRELIGKLGNICNSGDPNYAFPHPGTSILPAMPGDSGFADRAARFSSFRSRSFNCRNGSGLPPQLNPARKLNRVLSSPSLKVNGFSGNCGIDQGQFRNSEENSSQTGSRPGSASSKKRKSPPKSKSKQIPSSPAQANQTRTDPIAKRAKSGEEDKEKEAEPQKDYIHVRARRGQATDSHSLAERVRREKISERMKLLQDIVPGCNKVTGKALMLEEIINYVQSLQRQVEYLSMKLASTPPSIEFNPSNYFQNDIFQPNCSMQMDALAPPNVYGFDQNHGIQLPTTDGFLNDANELKSICEGDLHTIVDMGFRDNTLYTG